MNWLGKKKIALLITVLGGVAGYSYWYFIGCSSGSCGITAVWWHSTLYGMIMGWLLGDLINDKFNAKTKSNEK